MSRKSKAKITITVNPVAPERIDSPSAPEVPVARSTAWHGFAVSVPGNGHIRHELPCQDASAAICEPRPAVIVCDGRGSASKGLSQAGSKAAVRAFRSQLNVLEPYIAEYLVDHAKPNFSKPQRDDSGCLS